MMMASEPLVEPAIARWYRPVAYCAQSSFRAASRAHLEDVVVGLGLGRVANLNRPPAARNPATRG